MVKKVIFSIIRIWLGWQWISSGWSKLHSPAWTGDKAGIAISGFLKGAIAKANGPYPEVHGWYANFIEHVVLPNAKVFSFVVSYGEFLVGLALILGAFTLFAVLGSIFMNLNYLFAGTSSANPEMLLVGILILLFFIPVGFYGLDYYVTPFLLNQYNKVLLFLKDKKILPKEFIDKISYKL